MEDHEFVAHHGYRCTLPDVRLFVAREPETWKAYGYDFSTHRMVMEQPVNDSDDGKWHCQVWVNSFRGPHSRHGQLTDALQWEIY